MKLKHYIYETVRTLKPIEGLNQEIHLALGIVGELLSEVFPILAGGTINKEQLEEEIGDVMWYIGAYFQIKNFVPKPYATKPIDGIAKIAGDLVENLKKEWVYGKEFKDSKKEEYLQQIVYHIIRICNDYDIDFEGMLDKNIQKLKLRFPEKFEEEKAINKESEAEEKVFKNT